MIYTTNYNSPVGKLLLASKNNELIGLWIEGQKYYLGKLDEEIEEKNDEEILLNTKIWLDKYFKGEKPKITELKLNPNGSEFRKKVWKILCEIPYGKVTTYKEIAKKIAKDMNKEKMSAQAIRRCSGT